MALAGTARVVVVSALCVSAAGIAAVTPAQADRIGDARARADLAWTQMQHDGQRLERVVERSNGARLRLAQAQDRIRQNQKVVAATRVNLTHAQQALSASLVSAYKSPVPDPLQAALEAHSFGQVLEQFALLDRTNTYNAGMLKSIRAFRVEIARRAFYGRAGFVIGDIGPFGGLMEPYGEVTQAEVGVAFAEQAEALVESRH